MITNYLCALRYVHTHLRGLGVCSPLFEGVSEVLWETKTQHTQSVVGILTTQMALISYLHAAIITRIFYNRTNQHQASNTYTNNICDYYSLFSKRVF